MRMSGLGKPLCQQQLDKKELPRDLEYNAVMRFLIGDLIEAAAIFIMKASGVNVEHTQKKVSAKIGGKNIKGTLDTKINGKVWDIKSASPYAFEHKFGDMGGYKKLKEDDVFGYIVQGYLYSQAKNKDFGGWIVVNKASGEWTVCEAPAIQEEDKKEALALAEKNLKALIKGEKFKRCFTDTKETYKASDGTIKDTGNRLLPSICGFCDFKRTCWPDSIMYRKVSSNARFPKSVWYSKLKKTGIIMPLYFQTDVTFSDIYMNDNVWFAFPDSEDQKSGPDVIRELRAGSTALPIRVCKSFYDGGMWEDYDYDKKTAMIVEDLSKVQKVLDKGALVCFYMAEWTESLEKMRKSAIRIQTFAIKHSGALFDAYPPKDIKRYRP